MTEHMNAGPEPAERREVIVLVPEEFVLGMLNMGSHLPRCVLVPDFPQLPDGYSVRAVAHDWERRCFKVAVQHPSFDPVPDGCPAPQRPGVLDARWKSVEVKNPG